MQQVTPIDCPIDCHRPAESKQSDWQVFRERFAYVSDPEILAYLLPHPIFPTAVLLIQFSAHLLDTQPSHIAQHGQEASVQWTQQERQRCMYRLIPSSKLSIKSGVRCLSIINQLTFLPTHSTSSPFDARTAPAALPKTKPSRDSPSETWSSQLLFVRSSSTFSQPQFWGKRPPPKKTRENKPLTKNSLNLNR